MSSTNGSSNEPTGFDDEDEVPRSRRQCVDCNVWAPPTRTAHTLISSEHGWRLERVAEGAIFRFDWRCPTCWVAHKSARPSGKP
jgi:hypothetical protein